MWIVLLASVTIALAGLDFSLLSEVGKLFKRIRRLRW